MSGNEHIKMEEVVLTQLAKNTQLNKVFKLVSKASKGNLSVASSDQICGKYTVDLWVVAKIISHEVSKFSLSTKTLHEMNFAWNVKLF